MCAVTLPNNQKEKVAYEKLAGLLSVRLFVELDKHKDFDIDSRSQAIGSKRGCVKIGTSSYSFLVMVA